MRKYSYKILNSFLTVIFILIASLGIQSQTPSFNSCGFDDIHNDLLKKDYEYRSRVYEYEKAILKHQKNDLLPRENPNYTLPVVVHIIHNGGAENISDEDVLRGLENLNEAYANIGYYDQNTGVKTGIQFCLAQQDPNGNPTKGINRIKSTLTNMEANSQDLDLKNLSRWDPLHYINIWIVKEICRGNKCSVVGYAYLPAMHGTDRDGLVVEAAYFARTKAGSAVQIHELGHYLGLLHTFQGGCDNYDCKINGDKICDTPPDNSTFRVKCGDDFNSCHTDAQSGFSSDQNDMYWNYMDYGDFHCYSAFTEGQRKRMIYTVENTRKSLLDSKACISPCPTDILADFIINKDTFSIGDTGNFVNNSSNNATVYSWEKDGITISNNKDLSYQFTEIGSHTFTLKVYNSDKSCYDYLNKTIVVICKAKSEIHVDNREVLSGETINFDSPSIGIDSYNWIIDNSTISVNKQTNYTFYTEGVYTVSLIVKNNEWGCSDTSSIDIIVTCPVKSEFTTSSYFPLQATDVIFTNKSINATKYEWSVDGAIISNSQNLNYSFSSIGEYTVCLKAKNGNCEKEFCMQIFVVDEDVDDCEDVYFKQIGDPNIDETCRDFEFLKNGDILLVGGYDNESLILTLDNKLKLKNSQSFDFLSQEEYIFKSYIDTDGYLIISGMEYIKSNGRGLYILKFDISSKTIIWKKKISYNSTNYPTIRTISQLPNGNYLIGGQTYVNGCDALIVEIDKGTGNIIWQNLYNTGSCEVFRDLVYKDEIIYGTGRFAINSSSTTKFRNVLMKMDNKGNKIWSRNYLFSSANNARIYGFDMLLDNGLVILTLGDESGGNLENSKIQIMKTDLNGNLLFAKRLFIKNTKYNRAINVISLPDGYIVSGNYKYDDQNRKLLLFKINKLGDLIWSKSYKVGKSCEDSNIKYKNGFLYYIGTAINNIDKNIFILKLDINGNMKIDCDFEYGEIELEIENITKYREDIEVSRVTHTIPYTDFGFSSINPNLIENNICKKDCIDTCLLAPDASLIILDAQCKLDSFVLNFEVCNQGNYAIPINTPISFYTKNPLTQNSELIGIYSIPDSIPKDECKQFSYSIKSLGNITIYGFVNDNGTLNTPYLPNVEMPNTGIIECNWDNNLGYLELRKAKTKILELGDDTTMCVSGIVNLNAGAGFESYLWNDGSTDSVFTAWKPGKYWVEVVDMCGNIQIDSIEIIVDPATKIDLGKDINICSGESVKLELSGFVNYHWEPQKLFDCNTCDKVTLKPDKDVKVIVVANDEKGCYSSDTLSIKVYNTNNIKLPKDTTIYLGDKLRIKPLFHDSNIFSYIWSPGDGLSCIDCYSPEAFPVKTTTYILDVVDENGCTSSDDILIRIKKNIIINIPNIFTPNGDGKNDNFFVKGKTKGIKEVSSFKIFDRWGELIFEKQHFDINNPIYGWDGRFKGQRVNPGVYVYSAVLELLDSTFVIYSGDITVIR